MRVIVTRIDDKSGRLQVVPAGWVDAAASRLSPVEVIRSGHRAPEVTLCYLRAGRARGPGRGPGIVSALCAGCIPGPVCGDLCR
jgi:hypothetical protein